MNIMSGSAISRKPVFDAVRSVIGRSFTQAEVVLIDRALDRFVASEEGEPRLGALSERFETGGRGPGTVSSGQGDPGGVSYGCYQLSSKAGTVAEFMRTEGADWKRDFGGARPGSARFSAAWKAIAAREPEDFADAQHRFIRRTHYQPAVEAVRRETGLDCDKRHPAVRDAVWSTAVQHGRAARILTAAVAAADARHARGNYAYDRALVEAIYAERTAYVQAIAAHSAGGTRRTLQSVVQNRYLAERAAALDMFKGGDA